MTVSDTTTAASPAQEARFGKYTPQVERFLAALPSVKGDIGYGDHRDEAYSDQLWHGYNWGLSVRLILDGDDYRESFKAADIALEDLGAPIYSDRAVGAIIAQDEITDEQRELLYRPYQLDIPWHSLWAGEPLCCPLCREWEGRVTKLTYLPPRRNEPVVVRCSDCERDDVLTLAIISLRKAQQEPQEYAEQMIEDAVSMLCDVSSLRYDSEEAG